MMERFYKRHPVDQLNVEDFLDEHVKQRSDEDEINLAAMRRNGARFYWKKITTSNHDPKMLVHCGYGVVDRSTVEFLLRVTGQPYEFID